MTFQFSLPFEVDKNSSLEVYTGPQEVSRHLGHHNHILLFQQARVAYLAQFGYEERNIEGFWMFIVEVNCTYKREIFHQDKIEIKCRVSDIGSKTFFMSYSIEKEGTVCAVGSTTSICVDPATKKPAPAPDAFVETVSRYEGLEL